MVPTPRIVVTGVGAVTPIGNTSADFWRALVEGRSGVGAVTSYRAEGARPPYAGEVKDFPGEHVGLPRKKLKMMGRQAQLAFAAAQEAAADAGVGVEARSVDRARLGVMVGVGMLNADVAELGRAFAAMSREGDGPLDVAAFGREGAAQMSPLWLLRHIPNLACAYAAIALEAQGPSNTLATGCVAAANAIGEAARIIARGEADVMLAGGTDARVSPLALLRYRDLGWLATRDDIGVTEVSAPFDAGACGFVTAEGAAMIAIESLEHAQRRGARIRAELVGYGAANDAYALLQPHPEGRGLQQALARCLRRDAIDAVDVDVIFAPATSVPAFDRATARALERTFDHASRKPAVTATRSLVGHTHAASSAIDCVAAIQAIEESTVPPTINLRQPITDLPVSPTVDARNIQTALVAAYGFGGQAATLAWRRYAA